MQGKMKILGVEGVIDEENYRDYQEMTPFEVDLILPIFEVRT